MAKMYTNAHAQTDSETDTIVDAKPYVPANWQPVYHYLSFDTGRDTTSGFVLDTADTPSLVYRHKAGAGYPAICRLAPYNNYEWRNYELRGTIVKPSADEYDSVGAGVVFYQEDEANYYALATMLNSLGQKKFRLLRYSLSDLGTSEIDSLYEFDYTFGGDTNVVHLAVHVETQDSLNAEDTIYDAKAVMKFKFWKDEETEPTQWTPDEDIVDVTEKRKIGGYCGVITHYRSTGLKEIDMVGIKCRDFKIEKLVGIK
jgi:hypothetical protein